MKRVRFILDAPGAKEVFLAGDFTDWEAHARRMRCVRRGSGTFSIGVPLAPGTYEYKFMVDGEWREDPKAEGMPNCFGTHNSIRHVAA